MIVLGRRWDVAISGWLVWILACFSECTTWFDYIVYSYYMYKQAKQLSWQAGIGNVHKDLGSIPRSQYLFHIIFQQVIKRVALAYAPICHQDLTIKRLSNQIQCLSIEGPPCTPSQRTHQIWQSQTDLSLVGPRNLVSTPSFSIATRPIYFFS